MPDDVRFSVTAEDDASQVLDGVADKADAVDGRDVKVTAEATDDATPALEHAEAAADDLDGRDVKVTARMDGDLGDDVARATKDLKKLGHQAEQADKQMRSLSGGSKVGGNAIADITGPLGDAATAASDFGGIFDGLGDLVEGIAPKLGVSAESAENLGQVLGLVGVAAAAGAVAWGLYQQAEAEADAAAKALHDSMQKVNDALSAGDAAGAATQLITDNFKTLQSVAEQLGVTIPDLVQFITNQGGPAADAMARVGDFKGSVAAAQLTTMREAMSGVSAEAAVLDTAVAGSTDVLSGIALQAQAATDAVDALAQAQIAAANADVAAVDAQVAYADATQASKFAALGLTDAIAKHGAKSVEAAQAQDRLRDATQAERDAAIRAASAAVGVADARAKESGQTLSARDRLHALNQSLIANARTATPAARDQITHYIADVNHIPLSKATEIVANADTVAAETELNNAARPRDVDLIPVVRPIKNLSGIDPRAFGVSSSGRGRAAAPAGGLGVSPLGAPVAAAAAPTPVIVHVQVDARGAIDPYGVGKAVTAAADRWAEVAGRWRPGVAS